MPKKPATKEEIQMCARRADEKHKGVVKQYMKVKASLDKLTRDVHHLSKAIADVDGWLQCAADK